MIIIKVNEICQICNYNHMKHGIDITILQLTQKQQNFKRLQYCNYTYYRVKYVQLEREACGQKA